MTKSLKEKFYRWQKARINDGKQNLRVATSVKQRRTFVSPIDANPSISCLKNPSCYTDSAAASDSTPELKGISKGSMSADSSAAQTATTCGCSSRSKNVRFADVEIRQYERIASDNPCCSSGPPIGIGWKHGETHKTNIYDYEQKRGAKRFHLDFILSRKERETLLLEWDVDAKVIAASTRAANKTKGQRKQTVVNTRKYCKLEEFLESISRRFKIALIPSRQIDFKNGGALKSTASQTFATDHNSVENTVSTSRECESDKLNICITEPDDDYIEQLMNNRLNISKVGKGREENDSISFHDNFTFGATTIEDTESCTPSVYEIDKFHRELELELFGDETELPSMVGQTLEFPLQADNRTNLNTISGRISSLQDDIAIAGGSNLKQQQPILLERYPLESFPDVSRSGTNGYDAMVNTQDSSNGVPTTSVKFRINHHHSNGNCHRHVPFNHYLSLPLQAESEQCRSGTIFHRQYDDSFDSFSQNLATEVYHSMFSTQGEFDPQYTQFTRGSTERIYSERNNNQHRRSGSFDSSYSAASTQYNLRYSRPESPIQQYTRPVFEASQFSTASSWDSKDSYFRRSNPGDHRYARGSFHPSSRGDDFDGPQVHHVPLFGHTSANQLIDGTDCERCFYSNTTVTITETD